MRLVDIETLAVGEIAGLVARCPNLKPVISTNDKTFFTDGHIEVYQGPGTSKAVWRGRVPVQVKGRTGRLGKKAPRHSISRVDLRAYQRDSGVLFFYVIVDPKTAKTTPFYRLLSPFVIQAILRGSPEAQAQIPIEMASLPIDVEGLERLVQLALTTRAQNPSMGFDPILFEKAESITLYAATDINLDQHQVLAPGGTDFALVLNTSDGMSIHLDGEFHLLPASYEERIIEVATGGGGFNYETAVAKRVSEADFEVRVSEGLELSFHREGDAISAHVHLTLERTLSGRLKTLGFFLALLDTRVLSIGGHLVPVEFAKEGASGWLRRHLEYLRWLTQLLEHLGVNTTLVEPDQIDEQQYKQLKVLHRALVKAEEISSTDASPLLVMQKLGDWHLMLLLTDGSAPDKRVCINPFSSETRWHFWAAGEKVEQETVPVTAYDVIKDEYLRTVVNSRLDDIVSAYEAIADFETTFTAANQRVLALIRAADECERRMAELLDAATLLNDWLLANDPEVAHHQINAWQITARRSGLTPEQRRKIRELRRQVVATGADTAVLYEVAYAILLNDFDEVEVLLPQMDDDQLETMKSWPIWKLRPEPELTEPA